MGFQASPKSLAALVAAVPGARLVHGAPDTLVRGITQDTRVLEPGDLFVAIAGLEQDGSAFVPQARARGAAAVAIAASAAPADATLPTVLLADARRGLAELSAAFYDQPSRSIPVVGITGTDGKTSTTHLLSAILEAHGLRTGWLTTINTRLGAELRPNVASNTTPEAPVIQRTLAEMRAYGLDVAILETSSHALDLDRVYGTQYQVGVFTNLSPEHINFHGSFEAYRDAKRKLFERLPPDGFAVLNVDDPSVEHFRAATRARVVTYGLDQPAEISAREVDLSPAGTTFVLEPAGVRVRSQLIGRFNVSNWLAAYAAATVFGAQPEDLVLAAAQQPPVPGRMNLVDRGQPFAVVVDFAHTPQALDKALETVRALGARRVLLVFGLAGGRDAANRPVMGALASRASDFFVISTDDPGHEAPATIAAEIATGARPGSFAIELDRRRAVRLALTRAEPGDAVLLAGKGHENRMVVGDERQPWNDAAVAAEELAGLGWTGRAVP